MNNDEYISLCQDEQGGRIDKYLCETYEDITRSFAKKLLDEGRIFVNGISVKANYKVKKNDKIEFVMPKLSESEIEAENIPLDIVYEDSDMIVVNKPQGMVVHPAVGNYTGTLVNALLYHCNDSLSGINGEKRPGILHRIDKETSGLLMVAKNDNAHLKLSEQIKEHSLTRAYKAIVHGGFSEDKGIYTEPIGRHKTDRKKMAVSYQNSKEAVTHYNVIERLGKYTFVECVLETGRTHQIRVHMSYHGHPLVGDKTYGVKKEAFNLEGQLLHAYKIGFVHPTTGKYMEFESEIPEYFRNVLNILKNKAE